MKKILTLLFLCLFFLSGIHIARADHMAGAEISWQCLGGDSFRVTVTDYRDCQGIFFVNTPITVTPLDSKSKPFEVVGTSTGGEDITPVAPDQCTHCSDPKCSFQYGIEQYVITYKVVLDDSLHSCHFNISWQQCCRSGDITTGATWNDFHTESLLNKCIKPCDNSPRFNSPPITIFCKNQCISYSAGVQDDDGDSLVFKLAEPMQYEATPVRWDSGYSATEPFT